MSKSNKQSTKQTGGPSELAKTKKPKTQADRLKYYAEFFRTLPDTQRPLVGFGDDVKQYQKAPYRPTEFWLLNAGGYVHRVLRLGYLKEFENQLLAAYGRGGPESLWKEFVTILRARANLPCGFMQDYLKTFAEDCGLVADALRGAGIDIDNKQKPGKGDTEAQALGFLVKYPDWTNEQIADAIRCHVKTINRKRMPNFYRAKELLKENKQERPDGEKPIDPETGQQTLEAWERDKRE